MKRTHTHIIFHTSLAVGVACSHNVLVAQQCQWSELGLLDHHDDTLAWKAWMNASHVVTAHRRVTYPPPHVRARALRQVGVLCFC